MVVLLALALLAAPLAAEAQQPPEKVARIGYLSPRPGPSHVDEAFRQGLRELGYVDGQTIAVEYRWGAWQPDRIAAFAAELARLPVDVVVATGGSSTALAAKKAFATVPIVFITSDPVGSGLVASLNRPGGNLTGVNLLTLELNAKRLDLLKEAVPGVARVAVLVNPTNAMAGRARKDLEQTARTLRVTLRVLEARGPREIDEAFSVTTRERDGALIVVNDSLFFEERERIVSLAVRHRLPAVFEWREFAEAGGLLSYGASIADMYRRLATYVDKILKGAKPADLPIEQPTKFELVINLKTAKALGLTIPPAVLARADEVIQ
jgi:putative tryptophan/tyrosine transport system substrate-binding protein